MATRQTRGRHGLRIKPGYTVLEIAGSGYPSYRSDIITNAYSDREKIRIFPHQIFIPSAGMNISLFKNSFDYVICNSGVLEQAEYPDRIVAEITKIARKGYIETVSMLTEMAYPNNEHKWVILVIDGKLVFYEKNMMPLYVMDKYKEMLIDRISHRKSAKVKSKTLSLHQFLNRIEWKDGIECLINPIDAPYKKCFTEPWNSEMMKKLYPKQTTIVWLWQNLRMQYYYVVSKLFCAIRPQAITLEEYRTKQMKKSV